MNTVWSKSYYTIWFLTRGEGLETVTKPWVLLWSWQGNRTLGKQLGCPRKWFRGAGRGGRKGQAVDYASIPWEAPVPCRYLFCHGIGRGAWETASRDVSVPATGSGEKRGGLLAILALQRFGLKSSETQVGQPVGDKPTRPALSALCSPSLVCQPQVCSSCSQAGL